MNKNRRQRISKILNQLEGIMEEEQEYFENIPENMQDGQYAEKSQESIDQLEYAVDALQQLLEL